jgi:glycosyltransferase involved in cell wall biosynthesis
MKILLLNDYGTATGGAELQMLALKKGLGDRGHEVRLFSSRAELVPGSPLLADYHCFGATNRLQVISQTLNLSAYLELKRALKDFQPDVVHVRMFMWQLSPLILPLLRTVPCLYQTAVYKAICPLGTKVLPNGQSCDVAAGRACLRSGCLTPQTWAVLMGQRYLWQRWRDAFDRVVALSHGMKAQVAAAGIENVEVIYNGVAERPMRPLLSQPPTIAYAGRLVPEKGVDTLLRAIAQVYPQIPDLRLLIAGRGEAESQLRQLATALGIGDRVIWLGHLPRQEMERTFESAWVQVVPSQWEEPFGNVSTEAMMRGTAVIASRVGAQPEIVADGVTGFLVTAGDAADLAGRLMQVLNVSVAERMGVAGRQRALGQFSEDRCVEQFLDLYQRMQQGNLPQSTGAVHPSVWV